MSFTLTRKTKRAASAVLWTIGSFLVAGVLMTCLYVCSLNSLTIISTARQDLRATQILERKMNAIRLCTWRQVLNTNFVEPVFFEHYNPTSPANKRGSLLYTGLTSVSIPADVPESYRTNMRTITIRLYWTNFHGNQPQVHSAEMQARVSRYGMLNSVCRTL